MSGLLALLDDVAAIAKLAATSVDDVVGQAAKAGVQASGAVIDDAAVTPKYVHGFAANRELPIVWRIALGSIRNKLVFLLPAALLLSAFAPWAIMPLLMLGGAYLCFEGAEKVAHAIMARDADKPHMKATPDGALLEEERVAGAIKTDFILSAEIMTIMLAAIPESTFVMEALTLAAAGVFITAAVYGGVAVIVKADDVGLLMAKRGRLRATRAFGRTIVKGMPGFLTALSTVGTAAMLWVGGSIVIHGLESLGLAAPAHFVHDLSVAAGHVFLPLEAVIEWLVKAALDGVFGVVLGLILIPVANWLIVPAWRMVTGKKPAAAIH